MNNKITELDEFSDEYIVNDKEINYNNCIIFLEKLKLQEHQRQLLIIQICMYNKLNILKKLINDGIISIVDIKNLSVFTVIVNDSLNIIKYFIEDLKIERFKSYVTVNSALLMGSKKILEYILQNMKNMDKDFVVNIIQTASIENKESSLKIIIKNI